jgi:hypothetical protein
MRVILMVAASTLLDFSDMFIELSDHFERASAGTRTEAAMGCWLLFCLAAVFAMLSIFLGILIGG